MDFKDLLKCFAGGIIRDLQDRALSISVRSLSDIFKSNSLKFHVKAHAEWTQICRDFR